MQKEITSHIPLLDENGQLNCPGFAKKLYWQLFPPRGWKRFLPQALLDAPSAVDGLAAAVLVRRYLRDKTVK